MTTISTSTLTFSEISRQTFVNRALPNMVAVSRSHVSRVCRARVESSPKVGRAIARALGTDYYKWLQSVRYNQERFETFIRRSVHPEINLREFLDLLDIGLRVVSSPDGGFEVLCSKGYKYADFTDRGILESYDVQDAQERLDNYLTVLQQLKSSQQRLADYELSLKRQGKSKKEIG